MGISGAIPLLLRRLALVPLLVFAVLVFTYAITQIAPGDPVQIIAGQREIEPEQAERIREEFGLTGNFIERFGNYLVGLVTRGDLGPSYYYRSPTRSVQELLGERIWVSAQINLIVMTIVLALGIPLGVYAGVNRGRWKDPAIIGGLKVFDSIPSPIFIILVAVVFVEGLGPLFGLLGFNVPIVWTPGDPASYIIPVVALSVPALGGMARFVRVSLLTTIDDDYVRTAQAKGLTERRVLYGHVLRNALLPLSTTIGLSVVGVIGGSIVIETRYAVPGVGAFMFTSITQRDFNVVLGFTMLTATLFIVVNALVDMAYVFIDPRIRYTARAV